MSHNEHHFVLVHGDCHGAWCWYKVATLLTSEGHKVTALDMASSGKDRRQIEDVPNITDYFKPLMLFIEALPAPERVILVGHSRGGFDISIAMEKFPTKIAAAVFVAAAMPGPNLDFPSITKEYGRISDSPLDTEYTFGRGNDKAPTSYLMGPKFLASIVYDRAPPEDLTLAMSLIRHAPLYVDFSQSTPETVLTEENYGFVHRVYIVCEKDKMMKEELQRWLIKENPPDEVRVIDGSGHMVMMSKPQELCACLVEIATIFS